MLFDSICFGCTMCTIQSVFDNSFSAIVLAQNRPFNQQKQTTEEATWGMGTLYGGTLGGTLRAEREKLCIFFGLFLFPFLLQVDKMPPKFVSDGHLERDSASVKKIR